MARKRASRKPDRPQRQGAKRPPSDSPTPGGYASILSDLEQLITDSRRRALATVNRELVCLYWQIGRTIVQQQETAHWGDAVVEQLSADLRLTFPDMEGLSKDNLFRTRKFCLAYRELDAWFAGNSGPVALTRDSEGEPGIVATPSPQIGRSDSDIKKVATARRQLARQRKPEAIVAVVTPEFRSPAQAELILALSWSHHKEIIGACHTRAESYFYLKMAVAERWSVRELRRQIDSALFTRYVSVKSHPEKCLPEKPSIGLVLCKSADRVQVRLALTTAAGKIGVATYQTALPDAKLIQQRLARLPLSTEDDAS